MGPDQPQNDPESIRWSVRLSDKEPHKILVLGAVGILAFVVGAVVFRNLALGVVGFAIIFGSTAEYWFGSSFSVDRERASVRTVFSVTAIEWANVKRVVRDSAGIRLSPLEKAGTLDAFRGVYLRYGKDNQEQIERAVQAFGKLSDNDVVDRPHGAGDRSPD